MKTFRFFIISIIFCSLPAFSQTGEALDEETGLQGPSVQDLYIDQNPERSVEKDATQGSIEQAVGFYAGGTLTNASQLPLQGAGFVKLFTPRNRGFATFDWIQVLSEGAKFMTEAYPGLERLQVGDITAQHGGQLALHASHQNGLDGDVVYFRKDHREMPTNTTAGFDETFVVNGKVTANFDTERMWVLFGTLVKTGRIKRIFVHTAIKAHMCAYAKQIGATDAFSIETLRRLRNEDQHYDHFHMRITCPAKSPNCVQQEDPPAGSGCL